MTYLADLDRAKDEATKFLKAKKVEPRYLDFNREGPASKGKPRLPNDSNSEFLANRAMGDWAESTLADALRATTRLHVVHYGEADTIAAGEPGFEDFFLARLESVRAHGKRPDLLLFDEELCPTNVADQPTSALIETACKARASIEVRSSKFEAKKYIAARAEDIQAGKKGVRACPSFTVKVEDLIIVYRWLQHHPVPQFYAQVFLDSVYMISVLEILRLLRPNTDITIEKNTKNQLKSTIHIPVTSGRQVGQFRELPRFEARERVTRLGRHDAYVLPVGGDLILSRDELKAIGLI